MPDTQIYIQEYATRPEKSRTQSTKKHVQKIGNPTPLGLSAFAMCMMVLALYYFQVANIEQQNVLIFISLITGGVVQFASGMWEFKVGNTFGGTGFSAYGGFWASFSAISLKFGDVGKDQYSVDQYHNTLAVFCLTWLIFTAIVTVATIRTNLGVLSAFVFLTLTFLNETIYHFTQTIAFIKLAGAFSMLTSVSVWYCLAAVFWTPDLSPISLPLRDLSYKG